MAISRYGVAAPDPAAIGGVLQGVAAIGSVVVGGIATGVVTENSVFMKTARFRVQFDRHLLRLNKLKQTTKQYRDWMNNPANRVEWRTGTAAMNVAPRNSQVCRALYQGKDEKSNPGGHAIGSTGCRCKTAICAFNPSARSKYTARRAWLQKGPFEGFGAGATNPPHLVGRGLEWEEHWIQSCWTYLMTVAPAASLWNAQNPTQQIADGIDLPLVEDEILTLVYPELYGEVPVAMQQYWWNFITNARALNLPGRWHVNSVVPYFVFGFTQAEAEAQWPSRLLRDSAFNLGILMGLQEAVRQAFGTNAVSRIQAGDFTQYGGEGLDPRYASPGSITPQTAYGAAANPVSENLNYMKAAIIARSQGETASQAVNTVRLNPALVAAAKNPFKKGGKSGAGNDEETATAGAVAPNYTPLVASGLALSASLLVGYLNNK